MKKIELKAEKRSIVGRKVKKLRREGKVPANLYGSGFKSISLLVDAKEFSLAYKDAGETSVVELLVEKNTYPVLIHHTQLHPVDDKPLHIDFLKIDLKKKVTANIPLEIVGESPAEKQGLGTLVSYIDEVEVEALPGDLLDKIEVNVESLIEADQSLAIKDLVYDKSKLTVANDPETIVVKIELQKEEVVEVAPVAPAEGETAPAEGEDGKPAGGQEESSEEAEKETGD